MKSLSIILSIEPTTLLIGGVVAGLIVVIFIIRFFIINGRKKKFRKIAEELSGQANTAIEELKALFLPSRLAVSKDVDDFVNRHEELLSSIDSLEEHKYFDEDVFQETGIRELKDLLADSKQQIAENNKVYHAIVDLTTDAARVMDEYRSLVNPDHYFAHSELEDFISSYDEIKEKVNLVIPKYAQYVTDEDIKQLPGVIQRVEKEREEHNREFVQKELEANKLYFDHVLGTYPLDPQQRDSIVKLEDNCLVIASAGSGKTSTIVGKAKYMVEKRHVSPARILLLTYTKKAANELSERMKIPGLSSGTFHSLAYHIIAEVTGQAPSICEADVSLNVFRKLVLENEGYLHAINTYIIDLQSLMQLEHDYLDAFSYFEDRKKYRRSRDRAAGRREISEQE